MDELVWHRAAAADAEPLIALARLVPCPFSRSVPLAVWHTAFGGSDAPVSAAPGSAGHPLAGDDRSVLITLRPTCSTSESTLRAGVTGLLASLTGRSRPFLDRQEWWVRAAGGRDWFVTVHSSLYPPEHSRHWPLPNAAVLLVPRRAFDEQFPTGIPAEVRRTVRAAFDRRGQRYPAVPGAVASVVHD